MTGPGAPRTVGGMEILQTKLAGSVTVLQAIGIAVFLLVGFVADRKPTAEDRASR